MLIVGAGPVGLALALELTRHGARCRLVDERPPAYIECSRATEVHARSLELLDLPGIADEVVAAGLPVGRIPFSSRGEEFAALDLSGTDLPFPASLVIPQSATEAILNERLVRARVPVWRAAPGALHAGRGRRDDDARGAGQGRARGLPRPAMGCTAACARRSASRSRAATTKDGGPRSTP